MFGSSQLSVMQTTAGLCKLHSADRWLSFGYKLLALKYNTFSWSLFRRHEVYWLHKLVDSVCDEGVGEVVIEFEFETALALEVVLVLRLSIFGSKLWSL